MNHVRALLLTDLVDSTQLAERLGDSAAAELNVAHDRVARDLLRRWRGREIDKTDGMLMLFGSASDAAGYALEYHRALTALPHAVKARAGLHVGAVTLRSNSPDDIAQGAKPLEVDGLAKAVAARVMSLALGGQTLLTREACDALGRTELHLQSHGHWRVKGIVDPMELFEVGADRSAFVPPPDSAKIYRVVWRGDLWLPLQQVAHNLPAERDAFVGRHDALADLAQRFDEGARLVSLLGIGGTGKTRLAVHFGWTWLGDFPGGVWFCDLSQARHLDGLLHAVAQGLDVPLGAQDAVAQLGHAIAGRGVCLVVLDNFEQIARHAEATLGRWLDRAAEARFLVTTREVLGLAGEEAQALAPLGARDAATLFVQRAASARRDFRPAAEDEDAIPQLVRLLDGLPLAIEMAAARARVMSPSVLLSRMDQRFRLLVAAGGRQDRQATLRATFDWSWDLLSEAEKAALAQLSVFAGGFTLEAAEAVLDLSGCAGERWAVDVLQSLVDKSFVQRIKSSRFELLVSVQDYAAEHLRTPGRFPGSGDAAERVTLRRHGRYYASSSVGPPLLAQPAELDNLVTACRRATRFGDGDVAVATLRRIWGVLKERGPFGTGGELALGVLQLAGLTTSQLSAAHEVAGGAFESSGQVINAQQHLDSALNLALQAGEPGLEAKARVALGGHLFNQARFEEARSQLGAALDIARAQGDHSLQCAALNGIGTACIDLADATGAREHFLAALQIARDIGDRRWECGVLGNLGGLYFNQGLLEEAVNHFQAGLAVARELGARMWEGNALCNLGALELSRGELGDSRVHLEAALEVSRSIGHRRLECVVRCNLGLVSVDLQAWEAALVNYEAALSLAREVNDRRSEGLYLSYLGQLHGRRGRFAEAHASLDAGERLLQQAGDRYSLGLLLCHRVEVAHLSGAREQARATFSMASSVRSELGAGADSEFGVALDRAAALLDGIAHAQHD